MAYGGIIWSRDRWRHTTLRGQTLDPNMLKVQHLKNGWRYRLRSKGPPIGNGIWVSDGHVTYDVTWSKRCCEAVRSAILATAWLLVSISVKWLVEGAGCAVPVNRLAGKIVCMSVVHELNTVPVQILPGLHCARIVVSSLERHKNYESRRLMHCGAANIGNCTLPWILRWLWVTLKVFWVC